MGVFAVGGESGSRVFKQQWLAGRKCGRGGCGGCSGFRGFAGRFGMHCRRCVVVLSVVIRMCFGLGDVRRGNSEHDGRLPVY